MKILITPLFLIVAFSCRRHPDTEQLKNEILKTDRAMSNLAVKEGFFYSILFYADENIVKLNEGVYPVIGKKQFLETFANKPGPKTLTWEPVNAEAAESGDLGYSWGTGNLF